jgi:hypothetical protein
MVRRTAKSNASTAIRFEVPQLRRIGDIRERGTSAPHGYRGAARVERVQSEALLLFKSVAVYDYAKVLGPKGWRTLAAFMVGVVIMLAATMGSSAPAGAGLQPVPLPPLNLRGTVQILLTEQPWSSEGSHFGGFATSATLRVHFQSPDVGMDLQLRTQEGEFKPFTLIQTTQGMNGSCIAHYPFKAAGIIGTIGGFHETSSKEAATIEEAATIDLGVIESTFDAFGTGTGDGCGPHLAATGNPFGENPARMDIPLQATGPYAHGDLRFRSTGKQHNAGGTLVFRIDGTLHDTRKSP